MALLNSDMVIKRMSWHANHTEMSHLNNRLLTKPEIMQDSLRKIFASEIYSDNPLSAKLMESKAVKTISSNEWTWGLIGGNLRPAIYVGTAAVAAQGANFTTFDLTLDHNFYVAGDILTPGNPRIQVRLQSGPVSQGTRNVYRAQLMTNSATDTVAIQYLKPGARWNKLFSKYEEGAEQSGSTQYALPLELKSRLSKVRKHMKMTRDASNAVLSMEIPTEDGRKMGAWADYAEVTFWREFYREIEYNYWYSRNTTKVAGSTGRTVQSGPGILELLEESHTYGFTTFTGKLLQEFASDIHTGRLAPGSSRRRLLIGTGEYGMKLIHDAGNKMIKDSGFTILDSHLINKTNSEFHSNALSVGYQIVQLKFANGTVADLMHVPQFDDPRINTGIDPITGYPYESMRMVIMDVGADASESNVKLVKKDKGMELKYISGLVSPRGVANTAHAAHAGEYYEMHGLDHCGVQIDDITACGMLYPVRA